MLVLGMASVLLAQTEVPQTEAPLRVLFLGNSYTHTNAMPEMLAGIANSLPGRRIDVKSVTRGGATLADLWSLTDALDVLRAGTWDIVVLQDYSTLGQNFVDGKWGINDPAGTVQWMKFWNAEIQRKNAKPLLYLTWARRDYPDFQRGLNYAYSEAARAISAPIAPVGLAWKQLRETQPGLELFVSDGSHPSPTGTYVTACVFLKVLLQKTCTQAPTIVRITPEQQTAITEAAQKAVDDLNAGVLTNLARPDFGTLKPLPTPTETKPEDFQGIWKGKARMYSGVQDVELQVQTQGRACKGTLTIQNANAGLKLNYPLTGCTVDHVTLSFLISDPRQLFEEYRAVIDNGRMLGTQQVRTTNPYLRMMGSFELRKD